jgi:hypothetical protein
MASKRENKIALAKARRERGIISSQNRILDTIKKEEERMAFNQAMGSNVATAKPLTSAQEGRFYEATGLDNASNPEEAIKGEVLNTGLSFVQVANALANKAGGGDVVARGAGQVLGRMIPYGTGTTDSNKAIDTYTKWGTGNVTKGDVANVALSGMGIRAAGMGVKGLIPAARSVKASGVPIPVIGLGVGGGAGIIRVGGAKPVAGAARSSLLPSGAPRYATNAKQEIDRTVKTALQEVEDLQSQLDEAMRSDTVDTNYVSQLMSDMREVRSSIANDVVLNRGGQRPYGLKRDQEVALGLIDERGYPVYNVSDMSREEVGMALKKTLQEGEKRQQLLFKEGKTDKVDPLPDWNDPEYIAYVDDYYNNAVKSGNAVRTTGAEGQSVNWASLANDHDTALAAGGSNTYKNLIDTFGRANSQKGKG